MTCCKIIESEDLSERRPDENVEVYNTLYEGGDRFLKGAIAFCLSTPCKGVRLDRSKKASESDPGSRSGSGGGFKTLTGYRFTVSPVRYAVSVRRTFGDGKER